MTGNRALACALVLATVVLAAGGEITVLTHTGGPLGLFLLAFAAPAGMAAWLAIGAPVTRADIRT